MKKFLTIFCFTFSISFSQNKLLLKGDSAVWFGLDFSSARFMGGFAEAVGIGDHSASELINKNMPAWNDLFFLEPLNYDIGEAIKKPLLHKDIKSISKINAAINPDSLCFESPMPYKIKNPETTIQEMVNKYSSETKKSGLGCSIIVESFNKKALTAYFFIVLFDIENLKVIGYKRLNCIPKGFGVRNFWGGAIKDCLNQVRNSAYPSILWNATSKK